MHYHGKIMMQRLWELGCDWDEPVPATLKNEWEAFQRELPLIEKLRIPRWIHMSPTNKAIELHGFCDASMKAYGAAVYVRVLDSEGKIHTNLLLAKTKVAPSQRPITLPRLELCGAVLVAQLLQYTKEVLGMPDIKMYAWTDSTIALAWIRPLTFPPVYRKFNGLLVSIAGHMLQRIITQPMWCPEVYFHRKFKGWTIGGLVLKCRPKLYGIITGPLQAWELDLAHLLIIKAAQKEMFKNEIEQIKQKQIPKHLRALNPFIDVDGILRVGGLLENSLLLYNAQHPILLQNNHHLTRLVVRDAHKNTFHGGMQQMISFIRQKYWIGQIRPSVKHQLHRCISCYRQKAAEMQQLMGNLPSARVRMSRPFSHTGVDYAGPIEIKSWKARGAKILKGYFAIFICLATKAIHLEVVSDLTTQASLAAFRRFSARRGNCSHIYSDCGTNFVGANNELAKMLKEAKHDWKQIAETIANHGTNWHFIPPASPHFGGLWEAGVKSVKYHLKRVVGTERLTFEELATLLAQIEACLNSRPLCPLSESLDDLNAFTPAHFLVGESLHAIPQANIRNDVTHLDRWKRIQKITEEFWQKWNSEYLSRLQQRPKWTQVKEMPKIGDLVLLKDERLPSTFWNLARIEGTHCGSDGLVRVVTVKTKSGQIKRPIAKICMLPSNKIIDQAAII
ncbi:uncharacterized protein LOC129921511 [Episyrphus balteatus]|uniref:uncharacterized protein LOC129921511 n=1 Tax=Episyrphus balteatus TaxID=286459 RepID=UPI0024868B7F|nr:uncharacterized protein LOC129921511 [Episyrphus balteatus]